MENVVAFNNELSSLYEQKPPISKAKMAAITKSAMRAIKFYKHVVQSVEKFILKCKPEYKVPGLYVIDSIVRQSRHQFGPEKDVFAPRFARNVKETFANLFRCAPDDKSRIIRVLNLWQKNNVFAPEVIQPIFDLADPSHPIYQLPPSSGTGGASMGGSNMNDIPSGGANGLNLSSTSMDISMNATGSNDDKHGGMPDLSSMSHDKAQSMLDNSTLRQLEHMQQYLKRHSASATTTSSTKSSREMRESRDMREIRDSRELRETRELRDARDMRDSRPDRDAHEYARLIDSGAIGGSGRNASNVGNVGAGSSGISSSGNKSQHTESYIKYSKSTHDVILDDDDGLDNKSPQHTSKLIDNNNLQQLLNDPNVLLQLQTLQNFQKMKQQEEQYKMNEMRMQEKEFEKHLHNVLKTQGGVHGVSAESSEFNKEVEFVSVEQKIEVINLDGNDSRSPSPTHDRDRYKSSRRRSSRSRSRSRSRDRGRRRRSRSRSRSRSPRGSYRRRTSRDRDRDRSERSIRDKEKEREHERERRRKGLPDIRKEHLSVCSTTLWVGHLSKLVYQEELSDTFGAYGDIVSIDLIVPRGCAFIVMHRRQDANKAMQNLKNHKLQGRAITISWAAGKGVKSKEWKDFWDLELGVTYIPWTKLDTDTDFDALEEGGMFDEDSMPGWVKDKINHMKSLKEKTSDNSANMPPGAPPGQTVGNAGLLFGIDTTQPPPGPPPTSGPPPKMPMVAVQFPMAPPMGGPPRMLGPMGPMPLSGIPMPPNMVPGMPPPHPMMMQTGIMPPAFPPIPGQVAGGSGPPPGMGPPMGMPPPGQYPPPAAMASGIPPPAVGNVSSSDDQMDIEMDEEDGPSSASIPTPINTAAMNFNQPPPMFGGPGSGPGVENSAGDIFSRDRARERGGTGGNSRWGGRSGANDEVELIEAAKRWRENGGQSNFNEANFNDGGMGGPPNFNEGGMTGGPPNFNEGGMVGGPPNFNEGGRGGRGGGPMNMPPHDINNPQHRPDFMNDFDSRGGPRGAGGPRGGGNHNGDFYPNMQNRFNQPTSLMQMRIPPPNAFNQRMGGPGGGPMFMRGGHGGPGGGPGQGQGPGRQGFYNPRNPFDRDMPGRGGRGSRGGRGGGRGGGGIGGHGAPCNWSDEEGEDSNAFKRRGGAGASGSAGGSGNRFRDRDVSEDWHGRGGPGGNRRGGPGSSRDRSDRSDHRDNERGDRERGNRRSSRDTTREGSNAPSSKSSAKPEDTEADWDLELEEYKPDGTSTAAAKTTTSSENSTIAKDAESDRAAKNKEESVEPTDKKRTEDAQKTEPAPTHAADEPVVPETKEEKSVQPEKQTEQKEPSEKPEIHAVHNTPAPAKTESPAPAVESVTETAAVAAEETTATADVPPQTATEEEKPSE